jgi:uncharacterized protein YraI
MRKRFSISGAALLAAAAAMGVPVFAQPEAPVVSASGPSATPPEAGGPAETPPQGAPPQATPPQITSPQTAPPPPASQAQPEASTGSTARFAVVTANVNLRSRPGTDAEILTTIPAGSRVQVADCSDWCRVTWSRQSGFAIARNLDIEGTGQRRAYRTAPRYTGGPPPTIYETGPPVVYGPPVYYGPPAVYAPGYYWGPRHYGWYGPRYYRWHRRW